jgi:HEPN domain-containing protein
MNPDGKGKVPGSAAEWMSHARSDLRLARLAAGDKLVRREQVCFHAQQAAEKAIKAVLLSRGTEFPLTHDIEELLEIAQNTGMALPADVAEGGLLTPYAVETRYPGYWHEITGDELKEAIRLAEIAVKWAEEVIEKSGAGS